MYSDFSGNNRELLRLSAENDSLNYKDVSVLSNFISEQGKILPRRTTGLRAKQQKKIAKLIKQARIAALLPFVIGKT
jgi:small subunit ribosomal protein S18